MTSPLALAFVTYAAAPALAADDRLAAHVLARRGVRVTPAVWTDRAVRWTEFDAVILRSCWDYHLVPARFMAWLDALEAAGVRLLNPPPLVRWNMRKTYLRHLEGAGVDVVPSRWLAQGAAASLASVLDEAGWEDAVVKPVVSASAHETWRTWRAREPERDEERFRALLRAGAVLVQPFLEEVVRTGEWSLVFLGGAFSHAVLKRPASGDFRVQKDFGGSHRVEAPERELVAQAQRALAVAAHRAVYARVDGVCVGGRFLVMELELIEPSLYLDADPTAPERLADAILGAIGAAPAGSAAGATPLPSPAGSPGSAAASAPRTE